MRMKGVRKALAAAQKLNDAMEFCFVYSIDFVSSFDL